MFEGAIYSPLSLDKQESEILNEVILSVQHLRTSFFLGDEKRELRAVDDLSYDVHRGECVALIGESGSGKSVSALSILRLIQNPPGEILGGQILFHGQDLLSLSEEKMQELRGSKISMIFQEPSTALNPVMTIGKQISEPMRIHKKDSKRTAMKNSVRLLDKMKIPNAEQRVKQYPFEFSGGMQQRAMIAMAMSCHPEILIADEPTTALDVTVQAQVLEELNQMRQNSDTALIIITHNLGIVARYADKVNIVYGGKIVERGTPEDIFEHPHHPYTYGLIRAVPRLDLPRSYGLHTIEGEPPDMSRMPVDCCAFSERCPYATDLCFTKRPPEINLEGEHNCACFHMDAAQAEREKVQL